MKTETEKRTIHFIAGSTSDLPIILPVVRKYRDREDLTMVFHVLSCHRHLFQLIAFIISLIFAKGVWIVACGSKAFALPGIICAILNLIRKPIPVVGVALKGSEKDDLQAAILSIKNLPGKPVMMNRKSNLPFVGAKGLKTAIDAILEAKSYYPTVSFKDPPEYYANLTFKEAEDLTAKLAENAKKS